MSTRSLVIPLLWLGLVVSAPASGAPADAPVPLLFEAPTVTGSSAPETLRMASSRTVVRARHVTVRRDVLVNVDRSPRLGVGQQVRLNLFDDATVTATITAITPPSVTGSRTWSGELDGIEHGSVVLALQDDVVVGTVVLPGGVYRLGYGPDGRQVIEQVDTAALPEGPDTVPEPIGPTPMELGGNQAPQPAQDSAAQIDVMVVYTAAARVAAGGVAAIQAEINAVVAQANQAYANTGLVQRVRLVFAGEVAITESGNASTDLVSVRSDPAVAWLRDTNRADLVALITGSGPDPASCGIAFLMLTNSTDFAPRAFSVTDRGCAATLFTFVHELGHNMGAHHDPYVAETAETLFPYSHGYTDIVGQFRTIMAYAARCLDEGGTCPRILFFSTPRLTSGGRPMGTAATSDNASTLSQTADTVANFRQALVPSLTLGVSVNRPTFVAGEPLTVSVNLANPGSTGTVDLYLGVLVPNGVIAFFLPDLSFATGNVADLGSYRPVAAGVSLSTPFTVSRPNLFSRPWAGSEPRGGYVLFLLAVKSGMLAEGVFASDALLGAAMAPFTFQ